ncbi:MAG: hypothetical protein GY725_07375 [bacterium]|nr:hypothetical protein [bacterium]
MPVVTDMTVIQGDVNRRVGDSNTLWKKTFYTHGRHPGGAAILMLMVKGLNCAKDPVVVKINDKSVGHIFPNRWDYVSHREQTVDHWSTQIINIGPRILKNGNNELQIEAIDYPEKTDQDQFDDFFVRDVVCFFQQAA